MEIISFKKKNEVNNKKAAEIISKCKKIVIFVKKNLKINMLKINNIVNHCHYTGEYRGVTHSISNLK